MPATRASLNHSVKPGSRSRRSTNGSWMTTIRCALPPLNTYAMFCSLSKCYSHLSFAVDREDASSSVDRRTHSRRESPFHLFHPCKDSSLIPFCFISSLAVTNLHRASSDVSARTGTAYVSSNEDTTRRDCSGTTSGPWMRKGTLVNLASANRSRLSCIQGTCRNKVPELERAVLC